MDKVHFTLRKIEAYAAAKGATPEAVCRAATGNPRLYERLKDRVEYTDRVIDRLERHIAENPVDGFDCATWHNDTDVNGAPSVQGRAAS
jgi:hypothetical protein